MQSPQTMLISEPIRVNAYDIDVMGIVSNIVYVRWFEDLRYSFLERYMPYGELLQEHLSPMLLKTELNYQTPVTIHDRPVGEAWIAHLGKAKWVMDFCIRSGDIIHCRGNQTGCVFNLQTRRPAALPQRLLSAYAAAQMIADAPADTD